MSTDRDDEIIAAYAAGERIDEIAMRFGVPASEVERVVRSLTDEGVAPATANVVDRRPRSPLAVAGLVLVVAGLVGPCALGGLWLVIYYVSETAYPVAAWQYGNVAVGFSGICMGVVLVTVGLVLLVVGRNRK